MKIKLGFSPCPNDTFMFDALVNKKIDNQGFELETTIADVEQLNKFAFDGGLDVTKISFHVYPYVSGQYQILRAGAALGKNNGPLLIGKSKVPAHKVDGLRIAIPGKYTTANLLMGIAFPNASNKKEYLFSDIEGAVLSGEVDAGLIIHENRFTYQSKGLEKICDLGEYWEQLTRLPIPLGGIAIKRSMQEPTKKRFNAVLAESIRFAFNNPLSSRSFVKQLSQELSDQVVEQHIGLYVNEFSLDLGELGMQSIEKLYHLAGERGIVPKIGGDIFIK